MKQLLIILNILLFSFCGKSNPRVEPPRERTESKDTTRYAALFYFSGFGETLYTEANTSPSGDVFINNQQTPAYSGYGLLNFWGKPAWAASHGDGTIKNNYRFYFNNDPSQSNDELLNYHADLIHQAGIDLIVLDFTNGAADFPNGPTYVSGTKALCNSWQKRLAAGLPTPKIVFFVKDEAALTVVENTFFNHYNSNLFFNYLGKKLLLVAQPNLNLGHGDPNQPAVPTQGKFANYTARHCWGLDNSATCWQFKVNTEIPPNAFYYNDKPEQMCAPVATQATYMTMDGENPMPGAVGRQNGAYFKKYMQAATNVKPKFVFIHAWNEWSAGNWNPDDPHNNPYLVDLWGAEYSADIEPMAGGHGDLYYQMMKEEIAKFKKN